jgi:hypothetical protein
MEYFLRRRSQFENHPGDFSVGVLRITRNDLQSWRTLHTLVIARNEVTWQSPRKTRRRLLRSARNDIKGQDPCEMGRRCNEQHPGGFSVGVLRITRNERFLANAILRSRATKNLVHCKKHSSARRTRCFTSFSMTSRGGVPVNWGGVVMSSILGISRYARNDKKGEGIAARVIARSPSGRRGNLRAR